MFRWTSSKIFTHLNLMLPKIIIFVAITASVWSLNDHVRLVLKLSVALQGSSIRVNRAGQVSQGLSIISQAGIGQGRGGPLSSAKHPVGLGDLTSIPNTSTCPSTLRTSMHVYSQDVHKTTLGWIQISGNDSQPKRKMEISLKEKHLTVMISLPSWIKLQS